MEKRSLHLKNLLIAIFGWLFACLILILPLFIPSSTSALPATDVNPTIPQTITPQTTPADPNSSTSQSTQVNNTSSGDACKDSLGVIGWLVCPVTGKIAEATDWLYNKIENILAIKPLSMVEESPIHLIWKYCRGIANIVFIIFLLIVIYSQVTGLGINNYGVKRLLPKLIVAAILVNLSFHICILAVDISNIIGNSLRGVFTAVEQASLTSTASSDELSYSNLYSTLAGGTALGVGVGMLAFELGAIWMLIPTILGAFFAVLTGLITISLRQAVVILLVMISPLAFIAYMLPNTEELFNKWKKLFLRMLTFYPLFSLLFGASHLAGWALIASAKDGFTVLLGIAVQIFPLFFAWSLMKMSGTILGAINEKMRNATDRPVNAVRNWASQRRDTKRAEFFARQLQRPILGKIGQHDIPNPIASAIRSNARYNLRQAQALKNINALTTEQLNVEGLGRRIIGYKDGKAIYSSRPIRATNTMRREFNSRVINLRASATEKEFDNAMNAIDTYLEKNNIKDHKLKSLARQQGQNFLELSVQTTAAKRNSQSGIHFYVKSIKDAAQRDEFTGELLNPEAYHRLIERGAGADFFVSNEITDPKELAEAIKRSRDSEVAVIADAEDMLEIERKANIAKYQTYLSKQVSKEVDKFFEERLALREVDGIVAAIAITAQRGDYDKIQKRLTHYMDQGDWLELGTDMANTLALSLMAQKDYAPSLGRLGKHINVETWRYTNIQNGQRERENKFVTMKEFWLGRDASGQATKFSAKDLLKGTPLNHIDRTFFEGMKDNLDRYFVPENFTETVVDGRTVSPAENATLARREILENMTSQFVAGILSFESGGEQIMNTLGFMTGQKFKNGKWNENCYIDNPDGTHTLDQEALSNAEWFTDFYLKAFKPQHLVDMKSDAFSAIMARLTKQYGSMESAKEKFRNIFQQKGTIAALSNPDGTPNTNVITAMNDKIRKVIWPDSSIAPHTDSQPVDIATDTVSTTIDHIDQQLRVLAQSLPSLTSLSSQNLRDIIQDIMANGYTTEKAALQHFRNTIGASTIATLSNPDGTRNLALTAHMDQAVIDALWPPDNSVDN